LDKKEQDLKEKLERSLYRGSRILSANEWEYLKEEGLVSAYHDNYQYETEKQRFEDLRDIAKTKLERLERLFGSSWEQAEEVRTGEPSDAVSEGAFDLSKLSRIHLSQIFEGAYRDEAVHSRWDALHTYDQIHAETDKVEVRTPVGSAFFAGEGSPGGIPQWTILIHAQAWTPADQIKAEYQWIQDHLSYERGWKTQSRTFDVVRFVWEVEHDRGRRPSYPELMRLWNECSSESEAFRDSRAFRKCFLDGQAAVLPHYRDSDKQLREQIDSGSQVTAFDDWAEEFRRRL
jgi:hypothetical protein